MIGIVLATDAGLLQVLPGSTPRLILPDVSAVALDYRDGIALAAAPGNGVWLADATLPGGEERWQQVWDGDARCARIAPDGTLCVGAGRSTLMLSHDRGATWQRMETLDSVVRYEQNRARATTPAESYFAGLAFPGDGLVAAVFGAGAWYSADLGRSWLARSQELDRHVVAIWEHPERSDRMYAAADSGLYRSDDAGFSWIQCLGGLDRSLASHVAILPGAPDAILLSASRHSREQEGALFRSANGGVTWSPLSLGGDYEWDAAPLVTRLSGTPDTAFALAGGRLWGSHDRGVSWLPVAEGLPAARALVAAF